MGLYVNTLSLSMGGGEPTGGSYPCVVATCFSGNNTY